MTIGFGSSSNASRGSKNNWDIAYGSSNFNKKRGKLDFAGLPLLNHPVFWKSAGGLMNPVGVKVMQPRQLKLS